MPAFFWTGICYIYLHLWTGFPAYDIYVTFLDCFKNISVFLDWYVQGCRDMHVIRSFRKCFYSFLKYFLDFMRFEMQMCMFMWTFTRPASSDPGCLPYLYCWIEKQALQLSIIIVTLAEAVESVLLSLKIVTDLQFYLFFLINLLSSNHLILLPANSVFGIYTLAVEVNNLSLFLKNAVELIS